MFNATKVSRNDMSSFVSKVLTFDRDDELRYYWQYLLTPSSGKKIINALKTYSSSLPEEDFGMIIFSTWTAKKTYGCCVSLSPSKKSGR